MISERPIPYGILPDWAISQYISITPFAEGEKRKGVISYGLSSFGYDARLGTKFKLFSNLLHPLSPIDPKNLNEKSFQEISAVEGPEGKYVVMPPNSYILGETLEYFEIPRDVIVICIGKSTYSRCGLIANVTPLEPEWKGRITLEISNSSPCPAKLYAEEGIVQLVFLRSEAPCKKSYADKCAGGAGKYQNQQGLTLPKVD